MIESGKAFALLAALFVAGAEAQKKKTRTFTYEPDAPPFEHADLMEGSSIAGVILGIGLLGVFILTTIVIIIKDEINRHKEYSAKRDKVLQECKAKNYDFSSQENQEDYKKWKAAKVL